MASQKFKIPLNAAKFPFLYSQASRAVLQPGLDVAQRTPQAFFGGIQNIDYNVLQLLYCENVMPLASGLTSVGFAEEIPAIEPAVTDFDRLFTLRYEETNTTLFCPAAGKNYVWHQDTNEWVSHNSFTPATNSKLVTRAYVAGRTLVCYEYDRVIEWDPTLETFSLISLTLPAGVTMADIRGICGASNYLVLFTGSSIMWSSPNNILEFADTTQGAGRQTPIDLKGGINACESIAGGFIIYTNRNAVAASFTNNASVPFVFREVIGSGGISTGEQVTSEANAAGHYAYGSGGLQLVSLQRADTVFPELADFMVSREFEYWNTATKTVVKKNIPLAKHPKLVFLANRYLCISYAWQNDAYMFILIYDLALQRWGKIRIDHVDVSLMPLESGGGPLRYYELSYYDELMAYEDLVTDYGSAAPLKEGFIFLAPDGTVTSLIVNSLVGNSRGVILFGHIQVTRSRSVTFQKATFDGVVTETPPTLTVLPSDNGYERSTGTEIAVAEQSDKFVEYRGRVTAENFDLVLEGRFDLSTGIVETTIHGTR